MSNESWPRAALVPRGLDTTEQWSPNETDRQDRVIGPDPAEYDRRHGGVRRSDSSDDDRAGVAYDLIKWAYDQGAAGVNEVAKAKAAADAAEGERTGVQREIDALRTQIAALNPPCHNAERPAPAPAPRPVPAPAPEPTEEPTPISTPPVLISTISPAPTNARISQTRNLSTRGGAAVERRPTPVS